MHQNGASITNQNFDITSGRLATSHFVEYFTNEEIDDAAANSFASLSDALTAASSSLVPFIDYKASHARSSGIFPPEGIGYLRITVSNGLIYHYSLPVYELETINYSAPLNNDYSLPTCLTAPTFSYGIYGPNTPTPYELYPPGYGAAYIKYTNTNKFASKWLLTAITGRDYVDVNNNHMVDDSDDGYWISYDYQLWNSEFVTRTPYYGFDYQYAPDAASQRYPVYYPTEPASSGDPVKLTGLFASVTVSKSEIYYLSKIRTSSHTAVFIMNTRKDEKGGNPSDYIPSGFKPSPSLRVARILLFKNSNLPSPPAFSSSAFANNTSFDFSNINNLSSFYTEGWYQGLSQSIILKNITFDQDYSLCRNYHGNIEANCRSSFPLMEPSSVQDSLNISTYNSSGKLTLNRILTFDYQNIKVTPSTIFDYRFYDVQSNPDYNPIKADYWGFYKSDATDKGLSGYANAISKDHTKAWTLYTITDPMGAVTEIEYESNSYERVLDVEKGVRGPAFIYRIKDADTVHTRFHVTMEEGANVNYPANEFISLCGSTLNGLKKIVCLPFSEPTNPTSSYQGFAGIAFGESTLAIVPGGPTNLVNGIYTNADGAVSLNTNPRLYTADLAGNYFLPTAQAYNPLPNYIAYSGGGFILFETPIGYQAYGGGVRVKSISVRNSPTETYKQEYTYEFGTATSEEDRFDYQIKKNGMVGSYKRYDYLKLKNTDAIEIAPFIGYGRVTIKNLGRINVHRSHIETDFVTTPGALKNFDITTYSTTDGSSFIRTINECISEFTTMFGAPFETRTYDKNNNIVSKVVYEYETSEQGALTENFYFKDITGSFLLETVNILRERSIVLKRTSTFGMGTSKLIETLKRDELTRNETVILSVGPNNNTFFSYKTPAHAYYLGLEGLDFTSALSRRIIPLNTDLFTYSNIDTTLSSVQMNGYSASFLNAGYKLYSRKLRQLQFSSVTGTMAPQDVTLPFYIGNRTFQFDGGQGSIDAYGLLSKAALATNNLTLALTNSVSIWEPTTNYHWRLVSEISLIDLKRHELETRDANNRFSAKKYGYNCYYVNALANNCNYASFTFADFEGPPVTYTNGISRYDGEMIATTHTLITNASHTGSKCIAVSGSPVTFQSFSERSPGNSLDLGLQPGRIYRASVWTHTANATNAQMDITITGTLNSTTPHATVIPVTASGNLAATIRGWSLIQVDFEIPEGFSTETSGEFKIELKSNGGTVRYDDFILHPVEGSFSASVYDSETGRVISSLDANGLATDYFYDAAGKPLETWKEIPHTGTPTGVYKKVSSRSYNYGRGASN